MQGPLGLCAAVLVVSHTTTACTHSLPCPAVPTTVGASGGGITMLSLEGLRMVTFVVTRVT